MTIVNGYITRAEAASYMKIKVEAATVEDLDFLDETISGVSRDIDEYCDRTFYQRGTTASPLTRTVTAATGELIELADPIAVVTSIKVDDGTGTFPTEITDQVLLPVEAPIDNEAYTSIRAGATPWPTDQDMVQITGVWGHPVPPQVKAACRIQVARLMSRPNSPLGLQGFGDFGAMRVFGAGWDQDAVARLDPFRLNPINVGY